MLVKRFISVGESYQRSGLHRIPLLIANYHIPNDGKTIESFLSAESPKSVPNVEYDSAVRSALTNHSYIIETYGCQMNKADSNIMETLLRQCGMRRSNHDQEADVIIMNTCSVREHAELRIWNRLTQFRNIDKKRKKHTVLCVSGCMATRLKEKLLREGVDVVIGPDSYTNLPPLLTRAMKGEQGIDTILKPDNAYEGVDCIQSDPLPCTQLTIMRGCNNMCSYCVVPFTRGRERSLPAISIIDHVRKIRDAGYKEILLLGQNVNSYCDTSSVSSKNYSITPGFSSPTSVIAKKGILFPELLERIAEEAPDVRLRFMSPHPKDFPMAALDVIKRHDNICKSLHIPVQSGSNSCLRRMNRPYTKEAYTELIATVRRVLPSCSISTDVITGFCGESEEEHKDTLHLMELIQFDHAFMYLYSMRENTHAWLHYKDDIPLETKKRRLTEIQAVYQDGVKERIRTLKNKEVKILIEGTSKQSKAGTIQYKGRDDCNHTCVMMDTPVNSSKEDYRHQKDKQSRIQIGDYVTARILTPGSATHVVEALYKESGLSV